MTVQPTLGSPPKLAVDPEIIRKVGASAAVLYARIQVLQTARGGESFLATTEAALEFATGLSRHEQRTAIRYLSQAGMIVVHRQDAYGHRNFRVCEPFAADASRLQPGSI